MYIHNITYIHIYIQTTPTIILIILQTTPILTPSAVVLITVIISVETRSTHFRAGPTNFSIWFLVIYSKAISGVNRPTLTPWMFSIVNAISFRNWFSFFSYLKKRHKKFKKTCFTWQTFSIPWLAQMGTSREISY